MTLRRALFAAAPLHIDLDLGHGLVPPMPGFGWDGRPSWPAMAHQPASEAPPAGGGTGAPGAPGGGQPGTAGGGQPGSAEFVAPKDQAELDRIIGERLNREKARYADYDQLKQKAAEHDKTVEAQKTEAQKLSDRAAAAERAAADNELRALKAEVGLEKGLTASQIRRLHGTTRDELIADADELIKDLGGGAGGRAGAGQQAPHFDQGRQGGTPTPRAGEAGHAEAQRRFGKPAGQAGTTT